MNLKPPDPIEQLHRKKMNDIASLLDKRFNGKKTGDDRKVGFFLAVFPFGEEGRFNHISNSERADIVRLLQEILDRYTYQ